jgi:hypothetical protein
MQLTRVRNVFNRYCVCTVCSVYIGTNVGFVSSYGTIGVHPKPAEKLKPPAAVGSYPPFLTFFPEVWLGELPR